MGTKFAFFPEQASSFASSVDNFYFFMVALSVFFSVAIFLTLVFFSIKFRRKSATEVPAPFHGGMALELTWTVIPFILVMVMFFWSARLYFTIVTPPAEAVEMWVTGKQWMWKIQHLAGNREINELHVPVGKAVRLTMTSEDVLHDFYIPAFRTKMDVLPGRYTQLWFKATKPGKYHLFCAEYCGNQHSGMIGSVYVMEPQDYEAWLAGAAGQGTLVERGEKLFAELACNNCHRPDGTGRGPNLEGVFAKAVQLESGQKVTADENYIRESILNPQAKVVAGYQGIMPTFQGLVTEDQLVQLIEYIKSLKGGPATGTQSAPSADGV
ncbi:MAG: cytochrome c oxidase subunit II [Bryobacterales bacterium]|jgi:cytochrome c oxidase subunit II|nr:cytochrome c oxidase subunit II [Bryobacterales bacterium]